MALFTRLSLHCPVCRNEFDWHKGYGRDIRCCCKECCDEFQRRYAASILGERCEPRVPRMEG